MKITVAGHAIILESTINKDQLVKLMRIDPKASMLKDEHDIAIYAFGFNSEDGSITKNGICFNGTNAEGKMELTLIVPPDEDVDAFVLDMFGATYVLANTLEEQIANKAAEVAAKEAALLASIHRA